MKKSTHSIAILGLLIMSLACQAVDNLANNAQPDTPTPAITVTPEIIDTPTPTEPTPGVEAWIAFENQNNIWLVHPDGSGLTQITDNPQNISIGNLKWSPNGTALAYSQSDQNVISISLFDILTSKTIPLLRNVGGGFDWLPNGGQIVYDTTSTGETPGDFQNEGIWVVNVEDGRTRQIVKPTSDHPTLSDPQMSPMESYILFTIPCFEPNCVGYDVVDYETGNFVALPAFGGPCEWSPIALDIACIRTAAENSAGSSRHQEIVIFDKLGSLKQTFPLPESIEYTSLYWSPDGRDLVIGHYSNDGGQTDIVSLRNGESKILATGLPSDWSPDGVWVLTWESKGNGETPLMIFAVNEASGQSFPVTEGMFPVWQPVTGDTVAVAPNTESTVTPSLIPVETDTLTPEGPCTDVTIKVRDTNKGDYLQICTNGKTYEVGPLEKGGYAIGPNKMFYVYASNSGTVYTARIGDTRLTVLGDLKDFLFVKRDRTPQFEFQFFGDQPYTVEVHDTVFNQKKLLPIPRRISAPK